MTTPSIRPTPVRKGRSGTERRLAAAALVVAGIGLLPCEARAQPRRARPGCVPGTQAACACPGGGVSGVQVCDERGRRFGPCDCRAPSPPPSLDATVSTGIGAPQRFDGVGVPVGAVPVGDGLRGLVPVDGERRALVARPAVRWYGWQVLITDLSAEALGGVGLGLLTSRNSGAGIGFVIAAATIHGLAAPIIHWAHRRTAIGFLSLGLRVAIPGITAGLTAATNNAFPLVIGSVLSVTTVILDIAMFARETLPDRSTSSRARWYPVVSPLAAQGFVFGVGGTL